MGMEPRLQPKLQTKDQPLRAVDLLEVDRSRFKMRDEKVMPQPAAVSASRRMGERAGGSTSRGLLQKKKFGQRGLIELCGHLQDEVCAPPSLDKPWASQSDSAGQGTSHRERIWTRQRICGACECERRCGETRLWVQAARRSGPKRSLFRYNARKASGGVKGHSHFQRAKR